MKICVFGAGAVGAVIAGSLARAARVLSTDTRPPAIHRCACARDILETSVTRLTST